MGIPKSAIVKGSEKLSALEEYLIFLLSPFSAPPRIELNPTRQTVGPGKNPSITCTATGDEPLHIQWEAIGRPLPYSVSNDNGVLQFHGITYSDAGKYVCKATNEAGTAEAVAEVIVNGSSSFSIPINAYRIRSDGSHSDTIIHRIIFSQNILTTTRAFAPPKETLRRIQVILYVCVARSGNTP